MKIGIISDIHSNSVALEEVLAELKEEGVDKIFCAGDIVGYYTQPNRCIELLESDDVICVKGNHDEAIVNSEPFKFNLIARKSLDWNRRNLTEENKGYIESLQTSLRTTVDNNDLYMVHGSPERPLKDYITPADINIEFLDDSFETIPDLIILGHTHKPFVKEIEGKLVINPGSVGQPRDNNPKASYAVVDLETKEVEIKRAQYNIGKIAEEVKEEIDTELAQRLYKGV